MKADGLGKKQPVAPNSIAGRDNPAGRALNRRVEIEFTPAPAAAPAPSPDASPDASTSGPVNGVQVTATVGSVQRSGTMTAVRLTLSADRFVVPVGQFANDCTYCVDLSGFRLRAPATGEVFVPAVDRDGRTRVQHPRRAAGSRRRAVPGLHDRGPARRPAQRAGGARAAGHRHRPGHRLTRDGEGAVADAAHRRV